MLFHEDIGAFWMAPELRNDREETILQEATTAQEPQYLYFSKTRDNTLLFALPGRFYYD